MEWARIIVKFLPCVLLGMYFGLIIKRWWMGWVIGGPIVIGWIFVCYLAFE